MPFGGLRAELQPHAVLTLTPAPEGWGWGGGAGKAHVRAPRPAGAWGAELSSLTAAPQLQGRRGQPFTLPVTLHPGPGPV